MPTISALLELGRKYGPVSVFAGVLLWFTLSTITTQMIQITNELKVVEAVIRMVCVNVGPQNPQTVAACMLGK